MVGFTFCSENRTCPYILAGLRGKVWGLILPFTPVLDIIFFANLQAWLRSPSDVYPHIMCFGIPYVIICISTTQSFPQGPNVCVAMRDTLPGIWCSLNKYCDNDEWRNTGLLWIHQLSDGEFLCIKGPYDSLLISSVTYIPVYTFYYKYMNLSSIEELLHVFQLRICLVSWCLYPFGSRFLSICHFHPWIFAPCYKLNFVPMKRYVEIFLSLEPVNVTLFGSRAFAGIIELRWGHTWLGQAFISVWLVFLWEEKRTQIQTGKMLCDDGDWNHVFTRQVMPTIDSNHQKLGERHETRFSFRASGRDRPCRYLDLRLLASRTVR